MFLVGEDAFQYRIATLEEGQVLAFKDGVFQYRRR